MIKIGRLRIRPTRRGWTFIALVALLISSYTADAAAAVGRVRSGVTAGSLQLGGKTRDQALDALEARGHLLLSNPVELFADSQRITVQPSQISFQPDIEDTLDDALGVGRRGNIFVRMWQRVRALFASTDVGWESDYASKEADRLVNDFASRVDTQGHEAGIEARGTDMVPIGAVPGRRLDRKLATDRIIEALESWPRHSLELPISVANRHTTIDDARDAAKTANDWVKSSITLRAPDGSRHFISRTELAQMIDAIPRKRGLDWILEVRFDPAKVKANLGDEIKQFERQARDASFSVGGSVASVVPGQAGHTFDPKGTALKLADAAKRGDDRVADAVFSDVQPKLTTDQARKLNIHELVSTFTTHHPCCAARVTNIHKIADTVNGHIVKPGERFSLNTLVGERTTAKGYVLAPMIFDGEYKDDVGGGVSQFATTTYNAAYFGGYVINSHKAHTYYISRYPAGREATVSWPRPDLIFTNDTKSGILIRTAYDSTSLTVSFYGDKAGRSVEAETGPRTNPTEPGEQRKENPDLPPGQERVAQAGEPGFDITVTRVIRYAGGRTVRQPLTTHYKAEPKIIEFGPGASASPGPSGSPAPGQPGGPRPTSPPAATPAPTQAAVNPLHDEH